MLYRTASPLEPLPKRGKGRRGRGYGRGRGIGRGRRKRRIKRGKLGKGGVDTG